MISRPSPQQQQLKLKLKLNLKLKLPSVFISSRSLGYHGRTFVQSLSRSGTDFATEDFKDVKDVKDGIRSSKKKKSSDQNPPRSSAIDAVKFASSSNTGMADTQNEFASDNGESFTAKRANQSERLKNRSKKNSSSKETQKTRTKEKEEYEKNPHLFFDEARLSVFAGKGGDGETFKKAKAIKVKNTKFKRGTQQSKFIELQAAEPADGGRGGSVYIVCDRFTDSLLHLHERKEFRAKRGYHGGAAEYAKPGRERHRVAPEMEPLMIKVPPGTVVRKKRSGELIADLKQPGERVLVARGGNGGLAARRAEKVAGSELMGLGNQKTKMQNYSGDDLEISTVEVESKAWEATKGEDGESIQIELLMRIVADIGIVGLPNVGKSSILKAITKASPEIANYPFTTLMPNLGVVNTQVEDLKDVEKLLQMADRGELLLDSTDEKIKSLSPTIADLPGLIAGAHKGKGLGRAFLRHLRRTNAMVCVVDASSQDPVGDYATVREELRLYNPEYVLRPHVLCLNKVDVEWAKLRVPELIKGVENLEEEKVGVKPVRILATSAIDGTGMDELSKELSKIMPKS
jgi:GTPase involved in cell partitioning and DNA repair